MFVTYVQGQFMSERASDFDQCLDGTANDFSPTALIRNAKSSGIPFAKYDDYTLDTEAVRAFLAIYSIYLDAIDFTPAPGTVADPVLGWWKSDTKAGGDSTFGYSYTYNFGIGVKAGIPVTVTFGMAGEAGIKGLLG